MLYWKRILSEAGIDWTDVGRLASDRSGWKKLVKEKMDHMDVYERQLSCTSSVGAWVVGLVASIVGGW